MTLTLQPFGTYRVFPGPSSQHAGPIAYRSASRLDRAEWQNDILGEVSFHFGMGSYLQGAAGAHVSVRAAMETIDGVRFYFEYISRGNMESHASGKTPVILTGQIDIDPANEKYSWLNHTQVVGRGMLTHNPTVQTYDLYLLA